MNYKNIGEFSSDYFLVAQNKGYILKNVSRIDEIEQFRFKIEKICQDNNLSFFLTKSAKYYFELHLRNYEKLAKEGTKIKSSEFLLSSEFANYKNSINALIKRPLKDSQIQSAIHLIVLERSLNFSVPGSGKTATVLGAFEYLANRSPLHPIAGSIECGNRQ